jgi:hypothetical protein
MVKKIKKGHISHIHFIFIENFENLENFRRRHGIIVYFEGVLREFISSFEDFLDFFGYVSYLICVLILAYQKFHVKSIKN